MKESRESYNLNKTEKALGGAFSGLPQNISNLLSDVLDGKIDLNHFFDEIKGKPGEKNFYKRLMTGTEVKVLRSNGDMDEEGWIIDPAPDRDELNNETMVRVHNKQKHIAKNVLLLDLIL